MIERISGLPIDERKTQSKDLGEIMVIAHAVVAAESGQAVTILIDDGPGADRHIGNQPTGAAPLQRPPRRFSPTGKHADSP